MNKESKRKFGIITIYAIAMAFLESAVVIYIREIYNGNSLFQITFNPFILNVELIREFSTIVMLAAIGYLASKKAYEKFAYFIYAFAIWDIFYYIFLKLSISWPSSFLTWDLLFLIPWAWFGPVITPIIASTWFIVLAFLIINFSDKNKDLKFSRLEWICFIGAGILVLYTWLCNGSNIPLTYNWLLFYTGIVLVIIGICSFYKRHKK